MSNRLEYALVEAGANIAIGYLLLLLIIIFLGRPSIGAVRSQSAQTMAYLTTLNEGTSFFSVVEMRDKGQELRQKYNSALPFPHIVIDDFLPPKLLEECLAVFPKELDPDSESFYSDREKLKLSYNPDYLPPKSRELFYSLNSRPFLLFLKNVTGIKGLIPDPYFHGGGLHEIRQGGHLSVHADFNYHPVLQLERRVNLLIYMNRNWLKDYGGQLELWDQKMETCRLSLDPNFNRCVIFNTTSESFHGNPNPINHPKSISRRSIALYYYTATWNSEKLEHSTLWGPQTPSQLPAWRYLTNEFMPPIVKKKIKQLLRR